MLNAGSDAEHTRTLPSAGAAERTPVLTEVSSPREYVCFRAQLRRRSERRNRYPDRAPPGARARSQAEQDLLLEGMSVSSRAVKLCKRKTPHPQDEDGAFEARSEERDDPPASKDDQRPEGEGYEDSEGEMLELHEETVAPSLLRCTTEDTTTPLRLMMRPEANARFVDVMAQQ